jgi:hypothetical protein
MFTVVRAMAPVAAKPPKNGATTLPAPSARSSASGSCRVPVIPSDTTAQSSDSIAPRSAMAKALGTSMRMVARSIDPFHGQAKVGGVAGMPPKREAMVSTWNPGIQRESAAAMTATEPSATSAAGIRPLVTFGQSTSSTRVANPVHSSAGRRVGAARSSAATRSR